MIPMVTASEVFETLKPVMDPEHPISITDPRLGIVTIDGIRVDDDLIRVMFKPTVATCPMGGLIGVLIRYHLEQKYPDARIIVKVIPGTHVSEDAVNNMINNDEQYNNIIAQMQERGML